MNTGIPNATGPGKPTTIGGRKAGSFDWRMFRGRLCITLAMSILD